MAKKNDRRYDEYDDYDAYEDEEAPRSRRRNPLTPFLIALILLLALAAAIIVLLYTQLQDVNEQADQLNENLLSAQSELQDLLLQQAAAAAAIPEPTATPAPTPTPEPTPTPAPTPEPTPTPSPTPEPLLRDTVTDAMLNGVFRPADDCWLEKSMAGRVNAAYMMAFHWGPGMDWMENMALYRDDAVEILAKQNGWTLIRTADGRYGWGASELITETPNETPAPAATPVPTAAAPAVTAPPVVPAPTATPAEVSSANLS